MVEKTFLTILLIVSLCLLNKPLQAQHLGTDLLQKKDKVTIPFQLIDNMIIVPVKLGRLYKMNFIFDTGSTSNIIFEKLYTTLIAAPIRDTIQVYGANRRDSITAYICPSLELELKNTPRIHRDFLVLDAHDEELSYFLGTDIHGILGGDFVKGLVVYIDYEKRKLSFTNPRSNSPTKTTIQGKLVNKKPYVTAHIQDTIFGINDTKVLLDSGSSINILLNKKTENQIQNPNDSIFLGIGLSGVLLGSPHIISKLSFSDIQLQNIHGGYQSTALEIGTDTTELYATTIGNGIMKQFNWKIDYSHGWIDIFRNKYYNSVKEDLSGLVVSYSQDYADKVVRYVLPQSPAYHAGLLEGDTITSIGCFPSSIYDLRSIKSKLSSRIGKKIRLSYKRGTNRYKTHIVLQSYTQP